MIQQIKLNKPAIPSFTVQTPIIPDRKYCITDYGAVGNGIHDNTTAINATIQACSDAGGGTVHIPSGIWLTGPIVLKSKINLHVAFGALVTFSKKNKDFPLIQSSFEGEPAVRCQSPIDGEGLMDVAITGAGIFDGSGDSWRPVKKWKMTDIQWDNLTNSGGVVDENEIWWPSEQAKLGKSKLEELRKKHSTNLADYHSIHDYLRPNLLSLRHCKRVLIDGPTFQHSPAWNLHPWLCEHVTIQHVKVRNPWYAQNGDGLDIESCRYVMVKDCTFDVGDDAICIKSGKNEAGRKLNRPAEHILIEQCTVYSGHGGFVVGSEMSGGVRNVRIRDCLFSGTDKGIRFKTTRGRGGVVENIAIEKITMNNIASEAIIFQMYYESKHLDETIHPFTEETPVFRHIWMEQIVCNGAKTAIVLKGLPESPIEGIILNQATFISNEGIDCSFADHITFNNIQADIKEGPFVHVKNSQHLRFNCMENRNKINTFMKITDRNWNDIQCTNINSNAERMYDSEPNQNGEQLT